MADQGFTPGSLWQSVCQTCDQARRAGALLPIPTDAHLLDRRGLPFLVRLVAQLARKPRPLAATDKEEPRNPFLPYEQALYVADASATHVCLLNKFMVVDHHLLIVTRQFEHQQAALTRNDFAAVCRCLDEYEGLAFYNSGTMAGASQPHKHLQYVPLPLHSAMPCLPVEGLIGQGPAGVATSHRIPFVHRLARFQRPLPGDALGAAEMLNNLYRQMTAQLGLQVDRDSGLIRQAYNLLITRRWMLLVPRASECFGHISLNALAFAGALLVHHEDQLAQLQSTTWLSILRSVTQPLSA